MDGKAITTKLSIPKIQALFKKIVPRQKALVNRCGFGVVLDVKFSQLPRDLPAFLAMNFDCDTRTVNIPDVGSYQITPFTFHQILGIPLGGKLVDKVVTHEARRIIAQDTGFHTSGPTIYHLMSLVSADLPDEKFIRIVMMIILAAFVCPTSHPSTSPDYFNGIVDTDEIANHDWCSFALEWLVDKIRQFQISLSKPKVEGREQHYSLGGCLVVPLLALFDYVDFKGIKVRNCIPRLPAWDDKVVSYFDMFFRFSIGSLKLKDISSTCFVQNISSISSGLTLPNGVTNFIDKLILTDDDFNLKMKGMCTEFYKTSLDTCFAALQPVIEKQMCSMVDAIWKHVDKKASTSRAPRLDEVASPRVLYEDSTDRVNPAPRQSAVRSRKSGNQPGNKPHKTK